MTARYALLDGDTVSNIVIADEGYQHSTLETIRLQDYQYCEIGYVYNRNTQTFSAPADAASLQTARDEKIAQLQLTASAEIEAGYTSNALGSSHYYESQLINQVNLLMQLDVLRRSILSWVDWTCVDVRTGIKDTRPHSLTQLQKVLDDGVVANAQIRSKYRSLVNQVLQANTVAAIESVSWY